MPKDDDLLRAGVGKAMLGTAFLLTLVGMLGFSQMPHQPVIAAVLIP